MPFEISICEDGDMPATMSLFSRSLSHLALFWHLHPNNDTPAGQVAGAARLLTEKNSGHATFVKVTDTTTGGMAGCAIWMIFEGLEMTDEFFDLKGDDWDSEEAKEQARYAAHEFAEFRRNAIRNAGGNLLVLDVLAVAPEYQRQGVGSMLVQWGTDEADRRGFGAVVESSKDAIRVYEKGGFRNHYYVALQWPEKWAHLPTCEWYWMTRPPIGKTDAGKHTTPGLAAD